MGEPLIPDRGFVGVSRAGDAGPSPTEICTGLGTPAPELDEKDGISTAAWGLPSAGSAADTAVLLTATARRHEQDQSPRQVWELLTAPEPAGLAEVLPTFAAAARDGAGRLVAAADYLGFRHLYRAQGPGWAMVSTSSAAAARAVGSALDREALAVQSLLGWQVGQRTLFEGVHKLPPGTTISLAGGDARVESFVPAGAAPSIGIDEAVARATEILRGYLETYLDDHPDVGLQLTGGQDSRLLLSAIPVARRRGLRVVTLGIPGVADVDIAASFAARYGMHHEILSLSGLEDLVPEEAHRLCLDAARRLDFTADPVAHAALTFVESRSIEGPRLSGLGGEVARGFYYVGPPTDAGVTARRAERLAAWRMFVNESVETGAFDPGFAAWSKEFATQEVVRVLSGTGRSWMAATDDLYLTHRMQRWGGITETAVCLEREIVNPMLDDRFISVAQRLDPRSKRNSLFLSRLQMSLDADLGSVPLDGRPAPAAYAQKSAGNSAQMLGSTMGRVRRKALQRLRRANRSPAGGEILADKVVSHWRAEPGVLEAAYDVGLFRPAWLDEVVSGHRQPAPSAVSLLLNVVSAQRNLS